jgi:hypothetical protein
MNSNPLYHDYSFFSIFFSDFSPVCSGRHKTEAKYIAAIKLKWEVVFWGGVKSWNKCFCFVFVFVLLTIVGTIYILSSAIILQCLKDFYQEYSQKIFFSF